MNKKTACITGIATIFAIGMIAASGSFGEVSGETGQTTPTVPRYSETCAHGHNGYDCQTPQYRVDISELQKQTADLQKRVSQLERSR